MANASEFVFNVTGSDSNLIAGKTWADQLLRYQAECACNSQMLYSTGFMLAGVGILVLCFLFGLYLFEKEKMLKHANDTGDDEDGESN